MADRLSGFRILILESREEAQFSRMLQEWGADVVACPMFVIHDAPDPAPIEAWIERFVSPGADDLVLMTGEGLRRLMTVVRRLGREQPFVEALGRTRKFARGPKPVRALRELGLEAQEITETPTSEGIATMLGRHNLAGRKLALQLYPDRDHGKLIAAITSQRATVDPVLPYVYDPKAADGAIMSAIDEMAAGTIDAIALTSSGQVRRLMDTATMHGCEDRLRLALAQNQDRVGRTCGFGRTAQLRSACRHRSGQRVVLHAAADRGNGKGFGRPSLAAPYPSHLASAAHPPPLH